VPNAHLGFFQVDTEDVVGTMANVAKLGEDQAGIVKNTTRTLR
jgi:hypothetical protein